MDIDIGWWVASLFFSGIGYIYFSFGRKKPDFAYGITGIALMGYSYIVTSTTAVVVVGGLLVLIPVLIHRWR